MNNINTKLFILTLLNIPKVGKKTVNDIVNNISIYSLNENDILSIFNEVKSIKKSIKIPQLSEIISAKEKAKNILDKTYQLNINIITTLDSDFPNNLKRISDPPVIIFYKGNKQCLYEKKSVAIIGTRKPTLNGIKAAQRLGYLFGEDNFVVISGLAIGCDENVHRGCLDANGKTIAVLPCGLDSISPKSNEKLAQEIIDKGGCILSEYQVGVKAFKNYFIERDRLQSAFSQAIIVVETGIKGGTMHTVDFSKNQNKILAVYKPNKKYINNESVQGNKLLMENENTLVLDSSESINTLKNLIVNKSNSYKNENDIANYNYKQLGFLKE